MYYEILGPKRVLKQGDIDGGNYIKDISTAALPSSCNYIPIVPNGDCSLTPANEIRDDGDKLVISPNPASTILYLSKPFSEKYYLQIINEFGQVVLAESPESNDLSIDISTLPMGLYMIQFVINNRKCESFKFIKT